jgi:NitT/TauT family transport system substrate-binding protein
MTNARDVDADPTARRAFIAGTAAMGAASFLGLSRDAAADPPPETTRLRIASGPFICYAPQYLAEELLHLEGFTHVEYVKLPYGDTYASIVATGAADLAVFGPPTAVAAIDAGLPVVMTAGVHAGCWELFAHEHVEALHDLRGRTVSVIDMGAVDQLFVASILSYVGIDPARDVTWAPAHKASEAMRLFVEGRADAFLAFPPQPQELRSRKVGHVIVDTTRDRPWSRYFCCMTALPRRFVDANPVASKRALRAILKAADLCATEPETAAKYLVAKGYQASHEVALEVLRSLPYDRWRHDNPEDSLRFYALRLHEAGLIRMSPQKLIERGTDWRFLNELKRELKA